MPNTPWRRLLKPETATVVAPDGTVRWQGAGYFGNGKIIVEDKMADVRVDDEIRKTLPNGNDDTWTVTDPRFNDVPNFMPHYGIVVRRKGTFGHHQGGHFTINVNGANARVNIGSTDNSTNTAATSDLFADMRRAVEEGVTDVLQRSEILKKIEDAQKAKETPGFLNAYTTLIGVAADHLGVLTPFLPALTQLLK